MLKAISNTHEVTLSTEDIAGEKYLCVEITDKTIPLSIYLRRYKDIDIAISAWITCVKKHRCDYFDVTDTFEKPEALLELFPRNNNNRMSDEFAALLLSLNR